MPSIGRFNVIKKLGAGNQGSVYLCIDPDLKRKVAIKLLDRSLGGPVDGDSFLNEARSISQIQHPNIVSIFDVGRQKGRPYLVFEYVEGKLLSDRLNEPLPDMKGVLDIMLGLLAGTDQVHRKDIIHRDLKPANIILNAEGVPKIMDFGIARILSKASDNDSVLTGTPRYMAPEYISSGHVSAQADVFALGAIFFELLTGRQAFEAKNQKSLLQKIQQQEAALPSSLNAEADDSLDRIVLKALEKDPAARYASAGEMLSELMDYREASGHAPAEGVAKGTVDFLLRRMQHKSDFPVLSESIRTLNKLTTSDDKNTSYLASIIIRDFALSSKILKIVNSAYYSHFAGKIGTISRAIVVLGIRTIRSIASSLIFFDHLHNKAQADKLRNEIAAAIFSATLARQAAEDADMERVEESFLCGMLHNLGKILVTYYLNDESDEIHRLVQMEGIPQEKAEKLVLGITYQDVGVAIAEEWNFPDVIPRGMVKVDPSDPGDLNDADVKLRLIANFSNEAAEIIGGGEDDDEKEMKQLLKKYRKGLAISNKRFDRMMGEAREEFAQLSSSLGGKATNDPFIQRLIHPPMLERTTSVESAGKKDQDITQVLALEPDLGQKDDPLVEEIIPDDPAVTSELVLAEGLQEVTAMLLDDNCNISEIANVVLETIYRALAFGRVVLCLQDGGKKQISAKFGFGEDIEEFIPGFHFSSRFSSTVFHAALKNGVDLHISNTHDKRISKDIPDWYKKISNAGSFVIFPLVIKQSPLGMIYADHPRAAGFTLTSKQLNLIKTLRNQIILAFKARM